ncbi:MAG: VPLPA-CTERM sorting domain-containing protein [Paracoccaceae bacterium]
MQNLTNCAVAISAAVLIAMLPGRALATTTAFCGTTISLISSENAQNDCIDSFNQTLSGNAITGTQTASVDQNSTQLRATSTVSSNEAPLSSIFNVTAYALFDEFLTIENIPEGQTLALDFSLTVDGSFIGDVGLGSYMLATVGFVETDPTDALTSGVNAAALRSGLNPTADFSRASIGLEVETDPNNSSEKRLQAKSGIEEPVLEFGSGQYVSTDDAQLSTNQTPTFQGSFGDEVTSDLTVSLTREFTSTNNTGYLVFGLLVNQKNTPVIDPSNGDTPITIDFGNTAELDISIAESSTIQRIGPFGISGTFGDGLGEIPLEIGTQATTPVPLPASLWMLLAALGALGLGRRHAR